MNRRMERVFYFILCVINLYLFLIFLPFLNMSAFKISTSFHTQNAAQQREQNSFKTYVHKF